MKHLKESFKAFLADEQGATAIEYGLLAALIALAIVVTVRVLGTSLNTVFTNVSNALNGVGG